MDEEDIKMLRRMIEVTYMDAWGPNPSGERAKEYMKFYKHFAPRIGWVEYLGGKRFRWYYDNASGVA